MASGETSRGFLHISIPPHHIQIFELFLGIVEDIWYNILSFLIGETMLFRNPDPYIWEERIGYITRNGHVRMSEMWRLTAT